jgi:hypothetical protein
MLQAFARAAILACFAATLSGCAQLSLDWASTRIHGRPAASPPALAAFNEDPPVASVADWETRRAPVLRDVFQREIYGYFPDVSAAHVLGRRVVNDDAFGGIGVIESFSLRFAATFDGEEADTGVFQMDVVYPKNAAGPSPVILMQTFCPRVGPILRPALTGGGPGVKCEGGVGGWFLSTIFRLRIKHAPIRRLLERGYAIAAVYPSDVVPDRRRAGIDALDRLAGKRAESDTRWGAIAAWAWVYSRMVDVLERDPRIDKRAVIALGHSRYAKAALVAGAFDARIAAVVSNQSGEGGAALSRGKNGETVAAVTRAYPHWFSTRFDNYADREEALPVDQHLLIALAAPRPIFLGNARRDVWADPNGMYRAAIGADPVYELYGVRGLDQSGMDDFNPNAEIAYHFRAGGHGIADSDWRAILAFLDAHFKADPP